MAHDRIISRMSLGYLIISAAMVENQINQMVVADIIKLWVEKEKISHTNAAIMELAMLEPELSVEDWNAIHEVQTILLREWSWRRDKLEEVAEHTALDLTNGQED